MKFKNCYYPCPLEYLRDSANTVSLIMLTHESGNQIYIIHFLCLQLYLVIIPGPANFANLFSNNIFMLIVSTPLEIMGSVLSVNISSSENMSSFSQLLTMTVDPLNSSPIYFDVFTHEECMWSFSEDKGSVFSVSLWRLLSCLSTGSNRFLVIPPGYEFYLAN